MAKNSKGNNAKETINVASNSEAVETTVTKTAGRPIDPTSQRQAGLVMKALKQAAGIQVKRGRPVEPDSERQLRLAELEEKRAAGQLKPGRPKMTEEEKKASEVIRKQKETERMDLAKQQAEAILKAHPELLAKLQAGQLDDVTSVVDEEVAAGVAEEVAEGSDLMNS